MWRVVWVKLIGFLSLMVFLCIVDQEGVAPFNLIKGVVDRLGF